MEIMDLIDRGALGLAYDNIASSSTLPQFQTGKKIVTIMYVREGK
jgi:hypothetical protein